MKAFSNGLVPVRFTAEHGNYAVGARVRLSPREAQAVIRDKVAVAMDVPADQAVDVQAPREAEPVAPLKPPHLGIPDDWESLHHLQRVKIAEQISGQPVASKTKADTIIRDELSRRAAE